MDYYFSDAFYNYACRWMNVSIICHPIHTRLLILLLNYCKIPLSNFIHQIIGSEGCGAWRAGVSLFVLSCTPSKQNKKIRLDWIVEQLLSSVDCFPSSMGCQIHFMFKTFVPVVRKTCCLTVVAHFYRISCNFHSWAILMEWLWTKIFKVNM